jgi:ABC-2 type transport system permease protein
MALFAMLGARRTRTVAQIMAAVIGALFFLAAQARNFMPERGREAGLGIIAWIEAHADAPWLSPGSPLVWPAQALLGSPLPLLGLAAVAGAVFAAVVGSLGRRFGVNAAAAAGVDTAGRRKAVGKIGARAFSDGPFTAVVRKELRLLRRDPALLSQVLLRVLYLLPLLFVLIKNAAGHADLAVAGGAAAVVVMTGQLAGSLSWITISAEDSPDLLACAPVSRRLLGRAKITAAVLPVGALLVIPSLALAVLSPLAGVGAFAGAMATAASAALIGLWYQKPGRRKDFKGRRSASLVASIAAFLVSLFWAAATGLLIAGQLWFVVPALVAVALLFALRRRDPMIAYAPVAA